MSFPMDWMEKQCCLRCDKGGKLLVCNEKACPIVVHKKCLGCEAQFDDLGKFYCPYCIFKRVTEEMHQLRDKAMVARANLSRFIEEEMGDGTKTQKSKPLMSEKTDLISSAVAGDENCEETENNLKNDDCRNHGVLEEHHLEERPPTSTSTPLPCDETDELIADNQNEGAQQKCSQISDTKECGNSMMMIVYQPHLNPFGGRDDGDCLQCEEITQQAETVQFTKKVKAEPALSRRKNNYSMALKEKQNITEVDYMQEEVPKDTESLAPEVNLQPKFNKGIDILPGQSRSLKRKNPPESEVQNVNSPRRSNGVRCGEQLKQPSKPSTSLTFLNAKRGKMFWTPEEEDMLKEGVAKFSMTVNKNIPWRKILDFGCHVFNASRTPSDLKDKWRKILAKES